MLVKLRKTKLEENEVMKSCDWMVTRILHKHHNFEIIIVDMTKTMNGYD